MAGTGLMAGTAESLPAALLVVASALSTALQERGYAMPSCELASISQWVVLARLMQARGWATS
jgi:hypothetical protein